MAQTATERYKVSQSAAESYRCHKLYHNVTINCSTMEQRGQTAVETFQVPETTAESY
jgi:hypothetical protein